MNDFNVAVKKFLIFYLKCGAYFAVSLSVGIAAYFALVMVTNIHHEREFILNFVSIFVAVGVLFFSRVVKKTYPRIYKPYFILGIVSTVILCIYTVRDWIFYY